MSGRDSITRPLSVRQAAGIPVALTVMVALSAGLGCQRASPREEHFQVMGTYASVIAGAADHERVTEYARICEDTMREIEAQLSLYRPDSELSRLNAGAGRGPMRMGRHLQANLECAVRFGGLSGGAFDVTVGPLVKLWGFSGGKAPTEWVASARIEEARTRVGYHRIRIAGDTVSLDGTNMVVDLGGIAKGYAVDKCCEELLRRGAQNFLVNLGGNMRCFGRPESSRQWQIGVRDPFHQDKVVGKIGLTNGVAVSTSGNYERFVMIGDRRCAHILDPRTGYPVQGMAGVTVLAATAIEADALSTCLFVLGVKEGAKVAASLHGCAAAFIPDKHPTEIWIMRGMTNVFSPEGGVVPQIIGERL
jgi:thiamine biosynthesis lipoprotein